MTGFDLDYRCEHPDPRYNGLRCWAARCRAAGAGNAAGDEAASRPGKPLPAEQIARETQRNEAPRLCGRVGSKGRRQTS